MQQLLLKNAIKKRFSDGKMDFHLISAEKDGLSLLNCLNQAPGKKKTNCRISTSYLGCTHFLELCVICFALYLISFFSPPFCLLWCEVLGFVRSNRTSGVLYVFY